MSANKWERREQKKANKLKMLSYSKRTHGKGIGNLYVVTIKNLTIRTVKL